MPSTPQVHLLADLHRVLVENAPVGLVITRPDGRLLYHNPRAEEILGYTREELEELTAFDLYEDPADRQNLIDHLQNRGIHHYEYRLRRRDGRSVWVRGITRTVEDGEGKEIYLGFMEDISEQRRLREDLDTSQRELGSAAFRIASIRRSERIQLAREIERELGGPFQRLEEDLEALEKAESPAPVAAGLRSMRRMVDLGSKRIQRLARMNRPENLERGLGEALRQLSADFAQRTGLPTRVHTGAEEMVLEEELGLDLWRMVEELLDNAARHAGARQVEVALGQADGHVTLEVKDNGRGITQAAAASRAALGLTSIRERVGLWSGEFHIEGVEGRGTRARIRLPVVGTSPKTTASPWRLLLVSDYAMVKAGLQQILAVSAQRVLLSKVRTVEQVADVVWKQEWDALVVDFSTRESAKLELLRRLYQERPSPPVLVLARQVERSLEPFCLKAGAAGLLSWERVEEYLLEALERLVQGQRFVDPLFADRLLAMESEESPPHEGLSHREYQIFHLLAQGKKVAQIAGALSLHPRTIRTYRGRVLEKMGLESDAELMYYALQQGLVGRG